jgi:hypothetical protein
MGSISAVRNKLIDKYVKQGMTEDKAVMKADKESQVRTESQTGRTKAILDEAGTNAADIEKMMNKNVKRTGEENDFSELKRKVGSKKKYPSNLELLMYGKKWYEKKGKNLPKGK